MNRAWILALALAAAPVAARAQETDADRAYQRVTQKTLEAEQAPASEKGKVYAELFRECGTFLDQHLKGATQDQLLRAGGLWFLLAERLGAADRAVRDRIKAMRALPALPAQLTRIIDQTEARLAGRPGAPAPEWKARDVRDRAEVSQRAFNGKILLVAFWCAEREASRAFMQRLVPLHAKHAADERFGMVWVGLPWQTESDAKEKQAVEALGYTGQAVFDADESMGKAFKVEGVPHLVLIDEQGTILYTGTDLPQIERFYAERLKVPAEQERAGSGQAPPGR